MLKKKKLLKEEEERGKQGMRERRREREREKATVWQTLQEVNMKGWVLQHTIEPWQIKLAGNVGQCG